MAKAPPKPDWELRDNIKRAAEVLNAAIDEALNSGRNVEAAWKSLNYGRVTRFDIDSIEVGPVANVKMSHGKVIRVVVE